MGLRGPVPLVNILEDFWGSCPLQIPSYQTFFLSFSTLQLIWKLILIFLVNARVIPIEIEGHTDGGVTPFQAEILAANQPDFKFLLGHLCHFIVTLREDIMSRNQATCQQILAAF